MKPPPRLHVEMSLHEGATVALDAARAHYLMTVLRLGPGDPVHLFNGHDGEWAARLERAGKKGAVVAVSGRRRSQIEAAGPWLLFAPIKKQRLEWLVEKATELGVARLCPVMTERTAGELARLGWDRLRLIAVEAAEQCERLSVPEIAPCLPLDRALAGWPADRILFVCAEMGPVSPVGPAMAAAAGDPAAVLIGPEGGLAKSELDAVRELPFARTIGLGPRILRAETAAVTALACWQALGGDVRAETARPAFRD